MEEQEKGIMGGKIDGGEKLIENSEVE